MELLWKEKAGIAFLVPGLSAKPWPKLFLENRMQLSSSEERGEEGEEGGEGVNMYCTKFHLLMQERL